MRTVLIVFACVTVAHGSLWPSPKEDCKVGKKEDRCLRAFDIRDKCFLVENRKEMLECMVTCGTCDRFSCQNPFDTSIVNCSSLVHQCEDPNFANFMKEKCPFTCGKCNEKNGDLCEDAASALTCRTVRNYCNSVDFYDMMSQQCASTCNRCPETGGSTGAAVCRDYAKDCATKRHLCNDKAYSGLMARACAATCHKCNACEDSSLSCSIWASKGFCRNTHYSQDVKRSYCRRSCGICSPTGGHSAGQRPKPGPIFPPDNAIGQPDLSKIPIIGPILSGLGIKDEPDSEDDNDDNDNDNDHDHDKE